MIPTIPPERFQQFHTAFDGEGDGMWKICAQCGGRCEWHKIGTLMPGEKEYITSYLGLSLDEFTNKYLDGIVTPRGTVDVLKLKLGCPFLDTNYHCVLADKKVKPVLCEIYPVVFEVEETRDEHQQPHYQVHYAIDEVDCPLMHATYHWKERDIVNPRWQEHREYFASRGIQLLSAIDAPAAWYWIVAQYDSENFDYRLLEKRRDVPVDQYALLTLDDMLACRIGHDL
jgi:Fe-S-cluster containining protein